MCVTETSLAGAAQLRENASVYSEPGEHRKTGGKNVSTGDKRFSGVAGRRREWRQVKRREILKGVMRPVGGKQWAQI